MGVIDTCVSCGAPISTVKGKRNRVVLCDGGNPNWSCDAILCEKCATYVGGMHYCESCMKRDSIKKGRY